MNGASAQGDQATAPASSTRGHHRLEEAALLVLMLGLVVLAGGQILLRNLFGITWLWAEPLIRHLVLWSSFLGALVATRRGAHIRIDAGVRLLPPPWRQLTEAGADAVAAGVCVVLTYAAVRFVLDERTYGGAAFLDLPRWTLELIFPLVFGGMAMRFAGRAVAPLRSLRSRKHAAGTEVPDPDA